MPYTMRVENQKVKAIDWDAVAEAETVGALAVSRRAKHRRAKMTTSGLTTAQLRVLRDSASQLVVVLRRFKKPLRIGNAVFELSEHGKKEVVEIQGL